MAKNYFRKNIRMLLHKGFSDKELRHICYDTLEFRTFYEQLAQGMSKDEIIQSLLEYAEQKILIDKLLDLAKEHNEPQYEQNQPYYETVTPPSPYLGNTQQPFSTGDRLCERITKAKLWSSLERVAIQAATSGGLAAMGFYRQALLWPIGLTREEQDRKNPSTIADLQATARVLDTVNALLPMAVPPNELDYALRYLGEETKYADWFKENLGGEAHKRVLHADRFFRPQKDVIRVIVDGIDGTGSFVRGLPLFCSAVALLVDDQVRVSAIYDPIHHVVYSASLLGCYEQPEEQVEAWIWQVATGNRINLVELVKEQKHKDLKEEAIGIHLTRTKPEWLHAFLETRPGGENSMLERLAKASGGIYALNSGAVAMADVATGALGGFVNNITHLWDVAAGEVLVRACGGKVTEFNGKPIDYSNHKQTSVIAANAYLHTGILKVLTS